MLARAFLRDNWMIHFSNTKINLKRGGAFLIMVSLTGSIGDFALMQLARINANAEEMSSNWNPSIQYAGEMQSLLNDVRQAETQHAMAVSSKLLTMFDIGPAEAMATTELLNGESRTAFRALFKNTEGMNGLNSQEAYLAHSNAKDTYADSKWSVIVFLAVTVGFAVAMAVWITRQITQPIELAVGDDDWGTF